MAHLNLVPQLIFFSHTEEDAWIIDNEPGQQFVESLYKEMNNPTECNEAIDLKSGKAAGHDILINELYIVTILGK